MTDPADARAAAEQDADERAAAEAAGEASASVAVDQEPPAVVPDPTAGAFFDVDNTLLRGASIFHLARGLYRRKFFTHRDLLRFASQQAQFRLGGAENADHIAQARETALGFVRGHSVEEVTTLGEEIFDEVMARKVWPGTRAMARMHLESGQRVWLVTATPVEVANVIAARLGLTGALGTVSETVDGIYTGRLVGEPLHGLAKAEAVAALAEREGLDLARCSAYSDSANDIPMLSLVGHPCAVNPDSRLRAHAKGHGWRVRDYRRGRTAARVGLPTAAGIGALGGGTLAALALRRKFR